MGVKKSKPDSNKDSIASLSNCFLSLKDLDASFRSYWIHLLSLIIVNWRKNLIPAKTKFTRYRPNRYRSTHPQTKSFQCSFSLNTLKTFCKIRNKNLNLFYKSNNIVKLRVNYNVSLIIKKILEKLPIYFFLID